MVDKTVPREGRHYRRSEGPVGQLQIVGRVFRIRTRSDSPEAVWTKEPSVGSTTNWRVTSLIRHRLHLVCFLAEYFANFQPTIALAQAR